jgi:hypothetical protein
MTTRKRRPVSGQERQGGVTVVRGADRLVMAAVLMTSTTVAATIMASITLVAAAIAIGAAVIMATTVLVTTTAVTAGTAILSAMTTSIAAATTIGAAIFLASTVLVTTAAVTIGAGAVTVTVLVKFTVIAVAGAVMTVAVSTGAVALVIWDNGVDALRETFVVAVPSRTAIVTVMIADGVAIAAGAVTILAIICQSLRLVCLLLSKLHLLRLGLGGLIGDLVLNGHPDGIQGRAWLDGSEGQNQGQDRCFH